MIASNGRHDIHALAGQPLYLVCSLGVRMADNPRGLRIPDLRPFGFVFQVRSDLDDSIVLTKSAAAGSNPTLAPATGDGAFGTIRLDLTAGDLTIPFDRPIPERATPARALPYRWWLVAASGATGEIAHGYLVVLANVVEGV